MSEKLFYINGVTTEKLKKHRFSEAAEKRAEGIKALYPDARSSVMPLLYIAQEELGSITQEGVEWVASQINMPPIQVWEVASFYTMYYKKPVGKYHIQICRTLSCALRGAREITECVKNRLQLESREVSADGMWSFEEVECLGSCGTAPMFQINDMFFENLTPEKVGQIMSQVEKEKPDLRFSTTKDDIGAGLKGYQKSCIRESQK